MGGAALVAALAAGRAGAQTEAGSCPRLLDFSFNRLQDGKPQSLCQYAGKVLLVVNTASYCGFTPQYEGLEKLFAERGPRGLVVLGFPSNDFGGQEPGGSKDIGELCFNTYGVKFPMFEKSAVTGSGVNPFYAALIKATGIKPGWNFHKYLIDREGKAVASYPSTITPGDRRLLTDIDRALGG
ncbi:glutathione peroxidase [Derxia lacustris]|uniref:glutathione peroxidase n=1 Tax=Derxia lacustris TaxID=764842 RepID=UPI001F397367|nr:glutathione peroxidase [Derxia lacustris]